VCAVARLRRHNFVAVAWSSTCTTEYMILIGLLAVMVTVSKSRYVWKHLDDNVTYHTDN
jgi:hypothetical protein